MEILFMVNSLCGEESYSSVLQVQDTIVFEPYVSVLKGSAPSNTPYAWFLRLRAARARSHPEEDCAIIFP